MLKLKPKMKRDLEQFADKYVRSINAGNAALFAGAGLSVASGLVNWKELLREIAKDLKLDVDKETDLIALAQYYQNERGGRGAINDLLIDQFTKDVQEGVNHQILASLPIETFWTTNYDDIIEKSLEKAGKITDVKRTPENLATSKKRRDSVVYKMHGDISLPHEAVLTKDDYESYNENTPVVHNRTSG